MIDIIIGRNDVLLLCVIGRVLNYKYFFKSEFLISILGFNGSYF